MASIQSYCFLFLAFFFSLSEFSVAKESHQKDSNFDRKSFPPNFMFGAASAAYQYEGAADEDGKGLSIWDTFSHKYPNKILDHTSADIGDDFYHRYKEDIQIMKFIGLDAFRLSISWPRVIPSGKLSKGVNKAGIAFYNGLINELLTNGMIFWIMLSFVSKNLVIELSIGPLLMSHGASICIPGYDTGIGAPGRCSHWRNNDCPAGNSSTEPYLVAHNILLSHAAISKLYREKYKPSQKGEIGIVLNPFWFMPYSNSVADREAAQRSMDFMLGWFLDPLVFGKYPESMRDLVGERLPKFTTEESKLVKGSMDFLGLNYYTAFYAADTRFNVGPNVSYTTDNQVNQTNEKNGKPIGEMYPKGLQEILVYTKKKYNNPTIYIAENGIAEANITTVEEGVNDWKRVRFYIAHLKALKEAIDLGVNVKGYFPWTFMDTWEWNLGFSNRYGLNFVDYKNGLKRYPKISALWYKKFLKGSSCSSTELGLYWSERNATAQNDFISFV